MRNIKKLLEIIIEKNFAKIIKEGVEIYYEIFIFQNKKLIEEFPADYNNKDGTLFCRGSKRFPNVIEFNFIKYYSILLAETIKVKIIDEDNILKKY